MPPEKTSPEANWLDLLEQSLAELKQLIAAGAWSDLEHAGRALADIQRQLAERRPAAGSDRTRLSRALEDVAAVTEALRERQDQIAPLLARFAENRKIFGETEGA